MTFQPEDSAWSGRFAEPMDARLRRFNASIAFDFRLARFDLAASAAHAAMLGAQGIVAQQDAARMVDALQALRAEVDRGQATPDADSEDVHAWIERTLVRRIGAAGKRLHTARSRNDQVATALRLYVRDALDRLQLALAALQRALADQALRHADTLMPGYTHLQPAQPVTFGHHLMAYVEMLSRDAERLAQCRQRSNQLPLGAAALAGTGFPIDRERVARELGFDGVCRNSLDAVSDRDFALDFLGAGAVLMVHLSRLAEELILWSSVGAGFVELPDAFCTGSSIMPQKKNPDVPELVRGKAGRVCGHLVALLMTMKAQPLAYNKDNQECQQALFDADDTLQSVLGVLAPLVEGLRPDPERMRAAAGHGHSTATDLADHLVRGGLAFRDAHEVVARMVRLAEARAEPLAALEAEVPGMVSAVTGMPPEAARRVAGQGLAVALSAQGSVASRSHVGGTAPARVRAEAQAARERLARVGT